MTHAVFAAVFSVARGLEEANRVGVKER